MLDLTEKQIDKKVEELTNRYGEYGLYNLLCSDCADHKICHKNWEIDHIGIINCLREYVKIYYDVI